MQSTDLLHMQLAQLVSQLGYARFCLCGLFMLSNAQLAGNSFVIICQLQDARLSKNYRLLAVTDL